MTCVSTAQQATEPVDTKQPLSSLIGTFSIHPFLVLNYPTNGIVHYAEVPIVEPRQAR